MTDSSTDQTAPTAREMAIQALDSTPGELDMLISESARCGNLLTTEVTVGWTDEMHPLVQKMHDLYVFEQSICADYHLDRTKVSDSKGSLDSAMERYDVLMKSLITRLEMKDMPGVGRLLSGEFPATLARIRDLVPQIRTYVHAQSA